MEPHAKARTLIDKRMTEQEAIARFVHDGDYVGTELYAPDLVAIFEFGGTGALLENTGFELVMPDEVEQKQPPPARELQVLREEIDPARLYI